MWLVLSPLAVWLAGFLQEVIYEAEMQSG